MDEQTRVWLAEFQKGMDNFIAEFIEKTNKIIEQQNQLLEKMQAFEDRLERQDPFWQLAERIRKSTDQDESLGDRD